jgi:hypothetical protein
VRRFLFTLCSLCHNVFINSATRLKLIKLTQSCLQAILALFHERVILHVHWAFDFYGLRLLLLYNCSYFQINRKLNKNTSKCSLFYKLSQYTNHLPAQTHQLSHKDTFSDHAQTLSVCLPVAMETEGHCHNLLNINDVSTAPSTALD